MDILLEGRQAAAAEIDGPSERGGHFGSEPAGAKLFDPAILDFGAAANGGGNPKRGWTDFAAAAAAAAGLACVNFTIVFRGL